MQQEQLENELSKLRKTEFIMISNFSMVDSFIDDFIRKVNDEFGYNDGEPLENDGIKFILKMIELKWKIANAIEDE